MTSLQELKHYRFNYTLTDPKYIQVNDRERWKCGQAETAAAATTNQSKDQSNYVQVTGWRATKSAAKVNDKNGEDDGEW